MGHLVIIEASQITVNLRYHCYLKNMIKMPAIKIIEDESTASNLHENDHVHFYLQILYEK